MGGNERERERESDRERERVTETETERQRETETETETEIETDRERQRGRDRERHSVKDWIMTIIFLVKCKDSCQNGYCVNRKENICKCDIGWSGRTCNSSTNGE